MGDLLFVCGLTWLTMLTQEATSVKIVLIEKVWETGTIIPKNRTA